MDSRPVLLAATALVLLLWPFGARAAPDYRTSLAAAQREARTAGKPILALLVREGEAQSGRLERLLAGSRPILELLPEFVCVRPEGSERDRLVDRYDITSLPATLFFSDRGVPVKLVVGVLTAARFAEAMRAVLSKNRELKTPRPFEPPSRPAPPPRAEREFPHSPSCPDVCPSCSPALSKALGWLAARQKADGRLSKLPEECVTRTEDGRLLTRSIDHVDTALTALAGLAFLASGDEALKDEATRAARFLLQAVRPDGIVCAEEGNDYLHLTQCNFETPLAAMFLAEMQRTAPDPVRAAKLRSIADYLAGVQDPRSGAWGYSHDFNGMPASEKRGWRLLATTYCALAGLEWLRDAGVTVPGEVLERGARYVRSCLGRDGLFTYRSEFRRMDGCAATTAGALVALGRSGLAPAAELAKLRRAYRPRHRDFHDYGKHWHFFLLFTALAMNDEGEGAGRDFFEHIRDVLLSSQEDGGSWSEPDGTGGRVMATACAAISLALPRRRLPIASAAPASTWPEPPAKPSYVPPPHPSCRVKMFEHAGGYRFDLVVSTDGPADAAWFARFGRALVGANRILHDVTDGQMCLSRAVLCGKGERSGEADIRVLTGFYEQELLPQPFVHGITMVSERTTIRGEREKKGLRIGDWVMLPFFARGSTDPLPWDDPRLVRVLAHELAHYLLGLLDEYDPRTGGSRCRCLMGDLRATELCRDDDHSDPENPESCWAHAKALWPRLVVPRVEDPGPWDPPAPRILAPESR
ncbi:MAG: hypothetical protein MUE73_14075 [Planctomycetes bacterium]|nr:hypothetical protein [Planctomycetota bacterium]